MKKKLLLFAAIMMVSTGLWAQVQQNVSYRYPVYNTDGVPTSGIKEWKTAEIKAVVLSGSSSQVTLSESWYVITGTDVVYDKGIVIHGNVNLILADGAKLTATGDDSKAGIQVSGEGNSLTIYGQDNQSGQLIATGGANAAGIGGGERSFGSNIFIATDLIIKADGNNPPETEITNTGDDLASSLAGQRYVNIEIDLNVLKNKAIGEINKAIDGVTDEDVRAIADKAITDISNATSEEDINSIKTQALKDIAFAISKIDAIAEILSASQGIKNAELNAWIDAAIADIKKGSQEAEPSIDDIKDQILYMINLFQDGKAEGKADLLGSMATEQDGPAVEVSDGTTTVTLYNPKKVNFIKVETEN